MSHAEALERAKRRWHSDDHNMLLLRALAEAEERDSIAAGGNTLRTAIPRTRIAAGVPNFSISIPLLMPCKLMSLEFELSAMELECVRLVAGTRILVQGARLDNLHRVWLPRLELEPRGLYIEVANHTATSHVLAGDVVTLDLER